MAHAPAGLLLLLFLPLLSAWHVHAQSLKCHLICQCVNHTASCCDPGKTISNKVTYLDLDQCGQSSVNLSSLHNFTLLEVLVIQRSSLAYLEAQAFGTFPVLKTLTLADVGLGNATMHQSAFKGLQVRQLGLMKNQLWRISRWTFRQMTLLEILDLADNRITFIEEGAFTSLSSLRVLNLDGNRLITVTPLWFSLTFVNSSGPRVNLSNNELTCDCQPKGISQPEYGWFRKSLANISCAQNSSLEECSPAEVDRVYQDIVVIEKVPLTLPCVVRGFPAPKISWILPNGAPVGSPEFLPISSKNGTLIIELVQLRFAGLYACLASNVAGTSVALYSLQVLAGPTTRPTITTTTTTTRSSSVTSTTAKPSVPPSFGIIMGMSLVFASLIFGLLLYGLLRRGCKLLKQRFSHEVPFNMFVNTPNILTLPENPRPIPQMDDDGFAPAEQRPGEGGVTPIPQTYQHYQSELPPPPEPVMTGPASWTRI
ncbi:leucine-rich repeat and immunoglobulin-like domain-containing nogo receptor-interacting protein 4 [Polypterus senegalus]|uniref:leucine-rich repeat and immunoglobulin-like domain-containing nogo receptor-interacting protein 4 n=1 Tax=Polypterus senegalus TaxID=55291 RepID=UPI001963BBFF|nr:leucine-rich repeat and immunoglobulin-like domain-containing nogo receptor-interacting protein 4 [Polypterus senegalus]